MKTKNVGVSIDFMSMVYTVHFFGEDDLEFEQITLELPGLIELAELATGVLKNYQELIEEIVEIPRELYEAILSEKRALML